jgi:predicted HTH transcriptional regulator
MAEDQVVAKLDAIAAILQLAFRDEIDKARREILADPVAAALVEAAGDWVESASLQERVAASTKQSKRTVQRRLANLVTQRVIEQAGSGSKVSYRTTGLI